MHKSIKLTSTDSKMCPLRFQCFPLSWLLAYKKRWVMVTFNFCEHNRRHPGLKIFGTTFILHQLTHSAS